MADDMDRDGAAGNVEQYLVKDPERFALERPRMIEEAGRAAAAWSGPRERGDGARQLRRSRCRHGQDLLQGGEYWLADPSRALEAQTKLFAGYMGLWSNTKRKMSGEAPQDEVRTKRDTSGFQIPNGAKERLLRFPAPGQPPHLALGR